MCLSQRSHSCCLFDAVETDPRWRCGDGHGSCHSYSKCMVVLPAVPPLPYCRTHLQCWGLKGWKHSCWIQLICIYIAPNSNSIPWHLYGKGYVKTSEERETQLFPQLQYQALGKSEEEKLPFDRKKKKKLQQNWTQWEAVCLDWLADTQLILKNK